MKRDSRLSSVLHVLLHLAHEDRPLTSEALGEFLHTNPVVVRRTLAGLRELGYVSSTKGHGGGWSLSCDLASVTLRDVYEAVGAPDVFAMRNRTERPRCLVEQAVNGALDDAQREARAVFLNRLSGITLAALSQSFNENYPRHHKEASHEHHH